MTWKVFAGAYADVYAALLERRCAADGVSVEDEPMAEELHRHLHRGIAYLFGDQRIADIAALTALALEPSN